MPLETQILRNDKPLDVPWDYYMLSIMYTVAFKEGSPDRQVNEDGLTYGEVEPPKFVDFSMTPIYYLPEGICDLVDQGRQTLENDYTYPGATEEDPPIVLKKGDVLTAFRSMK